MLTPKTFKRKRFGRNPNAKFYVCTNSTDLKKQSNQFIIDENCKTIFVGSNLKTTLKPRYWQFNTDNVFIDAGQEELFSETMGSFVEFAFSGVDVSIILFGEPDIGKTFKMSGLTKSYETRGLIPRTIQALDSASKNRSGELNVATGISFVEFSQNKCYDLLKKRTIIKSGDVEPVKIKSASEALAFLFRGEANRKLEKLFTHCSTSVFTIHIRSTTISQMSSSVYKSKIHFVEMPGFENTHSPIKSLPCLVSSNVDKMSVDWASRWAFYSIAQPGKMNRPRKLSGGWHLIDYLGNSFTGGIIILIGLINLDNLQSTLSALRFGSKVARLHIGGLQQVVQTSPSRLKDELNIKIRLLKEELEKQQMMKQRYYERWNICQNEAHHIERIVKAYLKLSRPDRNAEVSMLTTANPVLIFEEIKRQYLNEFNRIVTVYNQTMAAHKKESDGEDMEDIIISPFTTKRSQGRVKKSQSVSSPASQLPGFTSEQGSPQSGKSPAAEGRKSIKVGATNVKRKSRSVSSRKSVVSTKKVQEKPTILPTKEEKLPEIPEELLEKGRKDKRWLLQEFLVRHKDFAEEKIKIEAEFIARKEAKLSKMMEMNEIRAKLGKNRIVLSDAQWNRLNVGRDILQPLEPPVSEEEKSLVDNDREILTKFNTVRNELAFNHGTFIASTQALNNFHSKLEQAFKDYCFELLGETIEPIYASTFDQEIPRPASLLFASEKIEKQL